MFKLDTDGTTILMIRGNTGTVKIHLTGYTFGNNDRVYFAVKSSSGTIVKEAICEVDENGCIEIPFVNTDTDNLSPGIYSYGYTAVTDPEYDQGGKIVNGSGVCTPSFDKIIRIYDTAAKV